MMMDQSPGKACDTIRCRQEDGDVKYSYLCLSLCICLSVSVCKLQRPSDPTVRDFLPSDLHADQQSDGVQSPHYHRTGGFYLHLTVQDICN